MNKVLNGIDRIEHYEHLFKGRRIGLITAPSGLSLGFESTLYILHKKFGLTALFSPEHGVRGDRDAGDTVETYADPYTGVPVYSLYRKDSKRLTEEMLKNVDLVVYDIQDIGARFYTFIYTMLYAMEDCARYGKEFLVLDRLNPLGDRVEGNVLTSGYESFVGAYPLAMRYGLTPGEFALMANSEQNLGCTLHVIPVSGWHRNSLFPETGRLWVMPTMGIPRFETALLYPGMCFFEGTNLSEGRGTTAPFEIIGSPFIDGEGLAKAMNAKKLPGVVFRPVYFKPWMSKHKDTPCKGVQTHITDPKKVRPVETGLRLLHEIGRTYEAFAFLPPFREGGRPFIDLLAGSDILRSDTPPEVLMERFGQESLAFAERKAAFHLYKGGETS